MVSPMFTKTKVKRFQSLMSTDLSELDKDLSGSAKSGIPVELHFYLKRYSLNVMQRFTLGSGFATNATMTKEFVRKLENLYEVTRTARFVGDFLPALSLLDTFKKRQLRRVVNDLLATISQVVEEHKVNLDPENPQDIVDELLIVASKDKSAFTQKKDLLLILMDMFSVGIHTSSSSIEWFVYCLCKFPEWQDKICEELSQVIDKNQLPCLDNSDKTPVLNAALKEMYRMFPITPIGVARTNDEDDSLGTYFIPKNTFVFWNAWGYNRDPTVWDDPDTFRPDRYMDGSKHSAIPLPTFGVGPRMCAGANLAEEEIYSACALLCQRYKWQFYTPELHKNFDNGVMGMVLKPSLFRVVLSER